MSKIEENIKKEKNKRSAQNDSDNESDNEASTKVINKKLKQTTLDYFGYKNKTNETTTTKKSDNKQQQANKQANKESSKQIKEETKEQQDKENNNSKHHKERTVSVSSTTSSSSTTSPPMSPKRSSKTSTKKSSANRSFNDSSSRYHGGGGGGAPAFLSLESSMKDTKLQQYLDDQFICITDKYNKSKEHYLLIPIKPKYHQLTELDKSNLDLLKDMKKVTIDLINNKFKQKDIDKYKIGFHSIQSMSPLHMHICTNDFVSDCLKTKKHWNSFNTQYFIDLDTIIDHLKSNDDLTNLIEPKNKLDEYLKMNLKCNQCKQTLSNIPKLKDHLLAHYNKKIKDVDLT